MTLDVKSSNLNTHLGVGVGVGVDGKFSKIGLEIKNIPSSEKIMSFL